MGRRRTIGTYRKAHEDNRVMAVAKAQRPKPAYERQVLCTACHQGFRTWIDVLVCQACREGR